MNLGGVINNVVYSQFLNELNLVEIQSNNIIFSDKFISILDNLKNEIKINESSREFKINELPNPMAIQLIYEYHHHKILNLVDDISEIVLTINNECLKNNWYDYLQTIDNKKIIFSDNHTCSLKLSKALKKLMGIKKQTRIVVKIYEGLPVASIIQKIVEIDMECFTGNVIQNNLQTTLGLYANHFKLLISNPHYFVATEMNESKPDKEKVLAYLTTTEKLSYCSDIARKAYCVKQGLGNILLQAWLDKAAEVKSLSLHVREGNPAKSLYEKFGFKVANTIENCYVCPNETGYLMINEKDEV